MYTNFLYLTSNNKTAVLGYMSQSLHQTLKMYGKEVQWQVANHSGWYGNNK